MDKILELFEDLIAEIIVEDPGLVQVGYWIFITLIVLFYL